jgi:hypothetical protein
MSKFGVSATVAYSPATGIVADFESLFKQFEVLKSVRYTHFLHVWKQMHMSFIFAGRQTDRECREVRYVDCYVGYKLLAMGLSAFAAEKRTNSCNETRKLICLFMYNSMTIFHLCSSA